MALTVTPVAGSTFMPFGRPTGGEASGVDTINDSTSTAVPPATTTFTQHGLQMRPFTVTGDTSYPTGGWALAASTCGLTSIVDVICTPLVKNDQTGAYLLEYDLANSKLMAFKDTGSAAALTQVANATNLSTYSTIILVIGHP